MGISGRSSKMFGFLTRELIPFFLCFTSCLTRQSNLPSNPHTNPTTLVAMSTATDIAATKRALLEKMQREIAELELAEEQKRQEEAAAAKKAAEEAAEEAAKKQREEEESARKEAEANEVRRAKKAEAEKKAEALKKAESADKGKKRGREELEVMVGSVFVDKGVTWFVKDGQVCEGCMKSGEKCFWRDSRRATACRHCNLNKKM